MRYGIPTAYNWNAMDDGAFRTLVRADFQTHYPPHLRYPARRLLWSENGDWFRRMAQKGWIAPNWPVEFGGMGLSAAKLLIFLEEQEAWGVARYQDHGTLMVGPVLINFGTEKQRQRFLPPILTCTHRWCQGYSEPDAGSDLAGLRTQAVRDGDEFIVNGQKIWTTMAYDVDHIFFLARTDANAKKQEGISFFLAELSAPGITVRKIRDIAGLEELCEVFFENVRVPANNLVGQLNQGWTIAKSLLGFERISLGSPKMPEYGLQVLAHAARRCGADRDPTFRDRVAALQLDTQHLGDIYRKFAGQTTRGKSLGPDVSLLKIFATELFQRIADLIVETAGPLGGLAGEVVVGTETLNLLGPFYKSRPTTIYGGTNEIQRNIIAKQVLDLPTR
jgi:alkylation response protein AidB-like acyl-CoA dehydrogenase